MKKLAAGIDRGREQGQHYRPAPRGVVERSEEDQGHMPYGPDGTDQHQSRVRPTPGSRGSR